MTHDLAVGSLFDISGRVVLVTGGSSGIGRMIATSFAANGARVYISGRDAERLEAARAAIGAHGDCRAIAGDLSAMSGLEAVASSFLARESRLDVLVNNAGASWSAPVGSFPESGFDRVMNLNLKAPFFLIQQLLPALEAAADDAHWSRIINLSSVAARVVNPANAVYGASKAAVEQMTRILARALAPHRVAVNAIAPGWFPSRMNSGLADRDRATWLAATPLGRFGDTADVGGAALFLASRAGGYVNGQTLTLDGGKTL